VDARLQHRARADQRGRRRGLQLVRLQVTAIEDARNLAFVALAHTLERELASVRSALDDCDLRPDGTLVDRIRALTHHHREWKQMYAALANRAVLSAALEGAKVERGGGWVKVHRLTPEAADMLVALVEPRSDGPEA
jgi:hypothetical protein